MSLISIVLVLFLIMDPIGSISSLLYMIQDLPRKRQVYIIIREMAIALIAMLIFNYIGEYIFNYLQITETTVRLSSGLILFLTAIKILFPAIDSIRANIPKEEPFVTPLAIPLIAGPSLLATIMLYAHIETHQCPMLFGILIAWFLSLIVLLSANFLQKTLGKNGLMACERLMGMVLVLLAVQRFMEGITLFYNNV